MDLNTHCPKCSSALQPVPIMTTIAWECPCASAGISPGVFITTAELALKRFGTIVRSDGRIYQLEGSNFDHDSLYLLILSVDKGVIGSIAVDYSYNMKWEVLYTPSGDSA